MACLVSPLVGCGGNTTNSGGPTPFAGIYDGSITVAGLGASSLTISISANGEIILDVPGNGIVCNGDIPNNLALDGDSFDASNSAECLIGGLPCPTTTTITGVISGGAVTGSGQVLVGCPAAFRTFNFSFAAN